MGKVCTAQKAESGTTAITDNDIRRKTESTEVDIVDRLKMEVRDRIELLRPLCGPHLSVFAHARHVIENCSTNGSASAILYRGRPITQPGHAFRVLADALACLAFRKGGVNFLGLHFDARKRP